MKKNIELGYNITTDPDFLDKQNAITPELSRKLERFYELALAGKKSSVKKILDAIEQYPDNPQLKNYLSVLYGQIGDTKKMYETNQWIIVEHPNYLFGKLNLANEHYSKQKYHKIPEILGEAMDLKLMYPNRNTFHINEVVSFLKCTVLYYTAIGDIEQAEVRYEIMHELAPEAADTEIAMKQLFAARMKAGFNRFKEERENKISVKVKTQEKNNNVKAPKFDNIEIDWLYSNGLYIGEEKIKTLLALPEKSLISDLELVLQDSIDRFSYFSNLVKEEEWDEEKMNFVVHAIYLLGELKSVDSIHAIFSVLSQSEEYIELYFGDFITSMFWEPVYKMANQNLEACKQFMFKPNVDTYARTTFPDMVEQLALQQPERRNEAIQWFKEVIEFFLSSNLEDNIIDSDLIGLLICNIINIKGKELLPEIEKLFEHGIVSIGICGVWNEVKKAFDKPDKYDKKNEILPIVERYKQVTSTWAGYNNDGKDLSFNFDKHDEPKIIPVRAKPKTGRNDPCPCGSGKKYKKCCFNNE